MTLRVGSLFSGIGGFDLGLERAGMRVSWQCEADAFCRSVLARHWPDVPCYPDVRELRGADVAPVDVLCGGFPCQDISVAGRGAGIDGERSGLWAEYARLVRELRPRYVIVENVAALLARGLERVLSDLASCGYDAEWDCIPAAAVGAPHRRDRLWLVAYPGGARRREDTGGAPGDESPDEGRRQEDDHVAERDGQGGGARAVADAASDGSQERAREDREPLRGGRGEGGLDAAGGGGNLADADREPPIGPAIARPESHPWAVEPDVGRVAHGVPARVDRITALGNALVPQIPELIGRRILDYERELVTWT